MSAFMLACFLNGALTGSIYFKSVNDCTYYSNSLSGQQLETQNGIKEYLDSRPQLVGIGTKPKVIIDGKEYATGTNPDYNYK